MCAGRATYAPRRVSVALSKIERGTERDFADMLALLQDGALNWSA